MLDLATAHLYFCPVDLGSWATTATLTSVDIDQNGFAFEFDKKDSWPDVKPPGWDGPLEYTIGIVRVSDMSASAVIQCWRGSLHFGGPVTDGKQIATNWFYRDWWGPLQGWQPNPGDDVGLFVAAGNCRGVPDSSQTLVKERSNVPVIKWPSLGFIGKILLGDAPAPPPPPVPSPNPLKQRVLDLLAEAESLVRQM